MKEKNNTEKGFEIVQIIIVIAGIIALSGMLYQWVTNTLQSGGISPRTSPIFNYETSTPETSTSTGATSTEQRFSSSVSVSEKQEESVSEGGKETQQEQVIPDQSPQESTQQETAEIQEEQPIEQKISTSTQEKNANSSPEESQTEKISFLRFVSSEDGRYELDEAEISELKSLNVNGIRICPMYQTTGNGKAYLFGWKDYYIDLIRKAHQAGFAVFLEPNAFTFGRLQQTDDPRYIDTFIDIALEWAKIAEEENVEFFSPLNEPNAFFATQKLIDEWIQSSKELKDDFSGGLVLKFADIGPEKISDIEGYDYLAFDIMWGDNRYNELRDRLRTAVAKGNSLKEKYNLKGFIFGELGAENSRVDENTQAEIFRTILEETWGKVDGYCFLGWSDLEFSFRDRKAEDVVKEWFSR